jgi:hypothetical protein
LEQVEDDEVEDNGDFYLESHDDIEYKIESEEEDDEDEDEDEEEEVKKMNQVIEDIKKEISSLSQQHQETGEDWYDFKEALTFEEDAEQLIIDYCESKGYLVNGFPTEKKKLSEEELGEDYFCLERYQLYLDTLATQKEDVADLMWHYTSSFWEYAYGSKEEYIQDLKDNLGSDVYYDVTI